MDKKDKYLLIGGVGLLGYLFYHAQKGGGSRRIQPATSAENLRSKLRRVIGPYVPLDMKEFSGLHSASGDEMSQEDADLLLENLNVRYNELLNTGNAYPGYELCNVYFNAEIPWHLPDDSLLFGFVRAWGRIETLPWETDQGKPGQLTFWKMLYEPVFIPSPNSPKFHDPFAMVPAGLNSIYTRPDRNVYQSTISDAALKSITDSGDKYEPFGSEDPCDEIEFRPGVRPAAGQWISFSGLVRSNIPYLSRSDVKLIWCDIASGALHNCSNLLGVEK